MLLLNMKLVRFIRLVRENRHLFQQGVQLGFFIRKVIYINDQVNES